MMPGSALPAVVLSLLAAAVSAYDFKDNYRDPAPSPEDGPPASFHAERNKARLPYEICGLVGAYVFTVLLWGILLLTLGRKMRRKALEPPALDFEQELKPIRHPMETPLSPASMRSATSWMRKFKRGPESLSGSTPVSPVVASPTSFDQKVLDADRARAQDDMERLYAAVMDHDAKKHSRQTSRATVDDLPPPSLRHERRRPSDISTTSRALVESSPTSPIRAIYPPDYNMAAPVLPPHSRNGSLRADPQPRPDLPQSRNSSLRADPQPRPDLPQSRNSSLRADLPPPSPRSILKPSRLSTASKRSDTRFNLKNLRISAPIQSYGGAPQDDEARTPLSPRFYPDQGAPPSPPTQPTSPSSPYSPTEPAELARARDLRIPLPNPAPTRGPSLTIAPPPPPKLNTSRSPTMTPTSSLPFRAYGDTPLKSPGIQTTVLDRRPDKLSLQTPRTGVPFTPYSPYMPFTPITPVTPHLVTRKERKGRRKDGGGLGRLDEMVASPKDIFGDAY